MRIENVFSAVLQISKLTVLYSSTRYRTTFTDVYLGKIVISSNTKPTGYEKKYYILADSDKHKNYGTKNCSWRILF